MKTFIITIIIFNLMNMAYSHGSFLFYKNVNAYYKFFRDPMTWNQAVDKCKQENSTLAMPRNAQEATVLRNIFRAYSPSMLSNVIDPEHMLLGFHDIFQEGEYITLNGDAIQYYYHTWNNNEPNNKEGNEDCGSLHRNGQLNDFPCQKSTVFICERSLNVQKEVVLHSPSTDSAYKSHPAVGQCYKLHLNPQVWPIARTICMAEGGHLAIIESKDEEDFLVSMLKDYKITEYTNYPLLGFHDLYMENHFVTVQDKNLLDSRYVRWASREPNNGGGGENCGSMVSSGGLNDVSCLHPKVYFCQRRC